ncbi:hypothetical protein BZA77DRAFT_90375 [Pyronema omphalodes]|nr:hypothetical protein BZA77DRAFT_90375 [Pyronema omphalodes]
MADAAELPKVASHLILWLSYAFFLAVGLLIAWKYRNQSKTEFLHSNRTQKAIPLALNFVASAMGSGILFSYPELGTIAGVQGVITYAACSAIPLLAFPFLAPLIRKKLPEGFILTMWVQERFGVIASLYISLLSIATMFLYMVAELSSLGQVVNSLTGLDGLSVIIVEVVVTSIYTAIGGFRVSFITDNFQGAMIAALIIICACAVGTKVRIDPAAIPASGLTEPSLLGYQLILMLLVGIMFSNLFLSGYWMRAFASKSDKDLWLGCSLAAIVVFIILLLVGSTGLIAVWSGVFDPASGEYGGLAFFMLLKTLPNWVIGFILIMVVVLSCAVFDSLQSAMVSTLSNDVFRNKLPLLGIRAVVWALIVPIVIIAIRAPSILQIFLITNVFASAALPSVLLGLSDKRFWFLRGPDVIIAGLGGMFSVWIWGTAYYGGDVLKGAELMILKNGMYANDWAAFGVFIVAPLGSLVFLALAVSVRLALVYAYCKSNGRRFAALDKCKLPRPSRDQTLFEDEVPQIDGSGRYKIV